jgi:hypothetical protein
MRALSVSEAWEQTKAVIAREGSLLAAVALALIVLPQIVLAVVGAPTNTQAPSISMVLYIAVVLLGFTAQVAIIRLAVGPSVTVAEAIAQGFVRLVPVFVVVICLTFAVAIAAVPIAMALSAVKVVSLPAQGQPPSASLVLLLVILAALVFAIFQLVFPIAAVETGNPLRMVTRSWQLARHNYTRLLGFVVIVFVGLALVGAFNQFAIGSIILLLLGQPSPGSLSALMFGLFGGIFQSAFTVLVAVMLARIYLQLADKADRANGTGQSETPWR